MAGVHEKEIPSPEKHQYKYHQLTAAEVFCEGGN